MPLSPSVNPGKEEDKEEDEHLTIKERASSRLDEFLENEGEEKKKDSGNIKDEKEKGEGIVADIVSMPTRADWFLTALISCELLSSCPPRAKKPGGYYSGNGEYYSYEGEKGYIAEELCVHFLFNYNGFHLKVNSLYNSVTFETHQETSHIA